MKRFCFPVLLLAAAVSAQASSVDTPALSDNRWFEDVKKSATPEQLYTFLYAMPKGADLHNHLSGSARSEWMWDAALAQEKHGYTYYTKVTIRNCVPYGSNEYGSEPYYMLFRNLTAANYAKLDDCQRSEFKRLQDLDAREKQGWLDSLRLDKAYEGRNEFFSAHWQRMNDLYVNPYWSAEILYRNMEAFGKEGLLYLETENAINGMLRPDGTEFSLEEAANIIRARLAAADARATGVEVRFQNSVLRFAPNAEDQLRTYYAINDAYRDLFVGINFVGREDDDKGYPLRFLKTLRELRHKYPDINLSIHAGEVDEPNQHVRDTLLLGAKRIGHGVNLITDPDTMVRMQHGPYLVEINLISNLLLEYVKDYSQHPFPEYLRTGIPVALSTDDRGMWDSNMTDEFFVAVKEFNLSWTEIVQMGRDSLAHSFVDEPTKNRLLAEYDKRIAAFVSQFKKGSFGSLKGVKPVTYAFICKHYSVCISDKPATSK
jgi:adenosine deaminase CECR1